jgi:thioredoxin-like negative regulator of GroEL
MQKGELLNLAQFQKRINQNFITAAYFSHDECNVCKVLKPQIKKITQNSNSHFEYINIKEHNEVAGQYIVFTVPTVIIFVNAKETKRFSRHLSIQDFKTAINKYALYRE